MKSEAGQNNTAIVPFHFGPLFYGLVTEDVTDETPDAS
jgi:hypothetical protein